MVGISVLGPLSVDGGATLGRRDRVVLEALALRPGDVVSAEQLADALWGDDVPASWAKVVQGCVMRLRKSLGSHAVETTPHGYRLVVSADDVDAQRFERLVGRGRELLTLGEPERAAYVLGEALGLWRGRAMEDIEDWDPGRIEANRLEEVRLEAEEARLDAALRAGQHRTVLAEAQALVAAAPVRERRWGLLALAQYQTGRQAEALRTLHQARRSLGEELGLDPGPDLVALEQAILQQDPSLLAEGAAPEPSTTCPYLGLVPYDVGDTDGYFGRDADVAACLDRLAATGVLAVVGPSGSGKSSLVRAGVAAALRRDGRRVVVVTPGEHPLDALTALPASAASAASAATSSSTTVLVVDQCEEAVTLCEDPDEQARFFAALAAHADREPLVVALRADRMGEVSVDPAFARLVERGLYLLSPMGRDDLRAAIEGPARQAGLMLEPGLVDLLLREIEGEPGALPLLSHALRQTWGQREGRTLTVAGYQETGGIRGAVAQSAEAVYDRVGPERQAALRALLLRLVTPTPDGEPVRCRVPRRAVATDPAHDRLIELLVGARLVTSDDGVVELAHEALARAWPRLRSWLDEDVDGQRVLRHMTVAADAWDAMGRPGSELYRGTRLETALAWRAATSPDLTELERAFLDASAGQAAAEREALTARARRDARQNRRLRIQRVALAVALVIALVVGVVAVSQRQQTEDERQVATGRELAAAANASLDVDPQRSLLLALEAVERGRSGGEAALPQAQEALHNAVTRSRVELRVPGVGGSLDWSPDGDVFVTEGPEDSGIVDIRDARTGESVRRYPGHEVDVNDVVFNHDGSLLATTGDDGAARIWDPATGEELQAVEPPGSGDDGDFSDVLSPSFSPDGRSFAAAWFGEGVVRVVDLASGRTVQEIRSIQSPRTTSFDPTGTRLAVSSFAEPKVAVFDVASGRELFVLQGVTGPAIDADWSPDGTSIATTGANDDVTQVFDAGTGQQRFTLVGDAAGLLELDWSPDGSRLVTGSQDGTVALWLVSTTGGRRLAMAPGPTPGLALSSRDTRGGVIGLAFSPDGTRLMAGNFDVSATTVWDVGIGGDAEVANLPARAYDVGVVGYTPDGRQLVASSDAGSLAVWDAHDLTFGRTVGAEDPTAGDPTDEEPSPNRAVGEGLRPASGPTIGPLDVHPDGRLVAGAVLDPSAGDTAQASVRAWDIRSGREVFDVPLGAMAFDVAWSPTGEVLAVSSGDNVRQAQVTILDRSGREVETRTEEPGVLVDSVSFTGDGEQLVMSRDTYYGNPDLARGQVVTWHWRDGRGRPRQLLDVPMLRAQLDPTGRLVAGLPFPSGTSQVVGLWDVASGEQVATLAGHTATVTSVAFSPDGSRLATSGADGTVRVWDVASGDEAVVLPGHVGGIGSVAFSPDGSHLASVGVEGLVRIWALDLDELVDIAERKLIRSLTQAECRQYLHADSCP